MYQECEKAGELLRSKELFIFDMDGTIYLGGNPFPFAIDFIKKLRANGTIKYELDLQQEIVVDTATRDQFDGNNVDTDTQMAELANAQLQYDALINSMNGNFTRMRSAMVTK